MTIEMLLNKYVQVKQTEPSSVDDLLDFSQRSYILGELSFSQYYYLYRQLNEQGAKKPDYEIENQKVS